MNYKKGMLIEYKGKYYEVMMVFSNRVSLRSLKNGTYIEIEIK